MQDNWHEQTHPYEDVQTTIRSLEYIASPDQLQVFSSDALAGQWLAKPVWSMDRDTQRLFIAGNEHGDILRFLEVFRVIAHPMLPLTVVNFDRHIDDAVYQKPDDAYASWQTYLYERRMTRYFQSYNVTAVEGHKKGSSVTQLMLASEFLMKRHDISIDLLSIDLDVYDDNLPGQTPEGDAVYQAINHAIPNARCVMPFLSPVFTHHGKEKEILADIFEKTIKHPMNPLQFV